jgi:hypothetical protein
LLRGTPFHYYYTWGDDNHNDYYDDNDDKNYNDDNDNDDENDDDNDDDNDDNDYNDDDQASPSLLLYLRIQMYELKAKI